MYKILRRLALALLAAGLFLYLDYRFSDGQLGLGAYLGATLLPLLVLLVSWSGWIVGGSRGSREWEALEGAFPKNRTTIQFPGIDAIAVGPVLSGGDMASAMAGAYPTRQGLMVVKLRSAPDKPEFFCVPWSRLKQISVPEPSRLRRCTSPADCNKLADELRAELVITRELFPPFKITIPWHYSFESSLPPSVDLRRPWEWPAAVLIPPN